MSWIIAKSENPAITPVPSPWDVRLFFDNTNSWMASIKLDDGTVIPLWITSVNVDNYLWLRDPNTNTPTIVSGIWIVDQFYIVSADATAPTWIDNIWTPIAGSSVYFDWLIRQNGTPPVWLVQSVNWQVWTVLLESQNIPYNNTISWLTAINTKTAIDELSGKVDTNITNIWTLQTNSFDKTVDDTDDITDTATNRFTNDTDVSRLANTSWTNTGDQDLTNYFNKTTDDTDDITEWTKKFVTSAEKTQITTNATNIWTLQTNSLNKTTDSYLQDVIAGTWISINKTDPKNPILTCTVAPTSVWGSDTQIQYNDWWVFAWATLYYDKTKKSLWINIAPQTEYQLDIAWWGMSLLLWAENLTDQRRDNQIKYFCMGMPWYLSATNVGTVMFWTYSSAWYTLNIWGWTTFSKAANDINFWTTTTAEGSNSSWVLAMVINQTWKVWVWTSTPSQALDIAWSLGLQMTTTSTTWIIYKWSSRFIHNFSHPTGGGAIPVWCNLFIWEDAGNFTMGSTATTVAQASRNIGIWRNSLANITLWQENIAMWEYSWWSLTTGIKNVILGRAAWFLISSGSNNTFIWYWAWNKIVTGSNNVVVWVANTSTWSNNTVVWSFSLYDTTTWWSMTSSMSIGYQCFRSVTGWSWNLWVGNNAGRFLTDWTTQVTSFTDCFYVWNNTRPSAVTWLTNETVIWTNAIWNGSNTITIWATTTTNNYLYGNIVTDWKLWLWIAPTSAIHLNKWEWYGGGIRFRSTDSYLYESSGYVFLASNWYDSVWCFDNAVNISLPTSLPSVWLTNSYIAYLSGSNLVFRVNVGWVLKSWSIALS